MIKSVPSSAVQIHLRKLLLTSPVLAMLIQVAKYKILLLIVNVSLRRGGLAMLVGICTYFRGLSESRRFQSCRTEPCITATSLLFTVSSTFIAFGHRGCALNST